MTMMPYDLLLRNGRLLESDGTIAPVDIAISEGAIAEISAPYPCLGPTRARPARATRQSSLCRISHSP